MRHITGGGSAAERGGGGAGGGAGGGGGDALSPRHSSPAYHLDVRLYNLGSPI